MTGRVPKEYRAAILEAYPGLAGRRFRRLAPGWDSVAVEAGGWVFKFPQGLRAEASLRREAAILRALAGRVAMPVPRLTLHREPMLFTAHRKLSGSQLTTERYLALPEDSKARLTSDLARFHADLHALRFEIMDDAGAGPAEDWGDPLENAALVERAAPHLAAAALRIARDGAALGPDPGGVVFGQFDTHGWNMAFDFRRRRLNGIYDFADAGFGPLHRDFVYSGFVSSDLTRRLIDAYEVLTGRSIDRRRVAVLAGMLRVWEVAVTAADPVNLPSTARGLEAWLAASPNALPRADGRAPVFPSRARRRPSLRCRGR